MLCARGCVHVGEYVVIDSRSSRSLLISECSSRRRLVELWAVQRCSGGGAPFDVWDRPGGGRARSQVAAAVPGRLGIAWTPRARPAALRQAAGTEHGGVQRRPGGGFFPSIPCQLIYSSAAAQRPEAVCSLRSCEARADDRDESCTPGTRHGGQRGRGGNGGGARSSDGVCHVQRPRAARAEGAGAEVRNAARRLAGSVAVSARGRLNLVGSAAD